ncbi:MAG: energy transducer TonB [Candidatus Sulfotelmatobacter sp.]
MSILRTIVPKPVATKSIAPATVAPKTDGTLIPQRPKAVGEDHRQRELMLGSLCLLLLALCIVLWHDRDFWFPDSPDTDSDQPSETAPAPAANAAPARQSIVAAPLEAPAKLHHKALHAAIKADAPKAAADQDAEPPSPVVSRTVLPPLEVEVVAGDTHRVIRPGSNSLRVDLQPGIPAQPAPEASETQTAANVTSNAEERVQMSAGTSAIVTRSVKPSYPLLARQMKVQGSVILKALIGRDGIIQNLSVVSGPHILASAAEDAVRQWHFKPHLQGRDPVETEAKITVNFTISTN